MVLVESLVIIVGGISTLVAVPIIRHEQRPLKIGSEAAEDTHTQHESWDAVVDNYVYIHNAFRNHLTYIRMRCENTKGDVVDDSTSKEIQDWKDILDLHSRVEDELLIPALLARLSDEERKSVPEDILSGKDHDGVKDLLNDIIGDTDKASLIPKLTELESHLDEHLLREEKNIMPLMLEKFTTRELWALDSFIVNDKLGYCDKEMLMKVTKWWFANISVKEGWPLLNNFIKAGKQPEMPLEDWKKLQDTIVALQKFPTEDLVH